MVLQESMCFKGKHGVKDPMARELIAIELAIRRIQARINLGNHVTIFCDNKAAVDALKRYYIDIEEGIYPKPENFNQQIHTSKLRVMTLINASGCKIVHIAREKNIMADFLLIVFKEQVRRDFGPEAEQEIEFINHIERMNEDFKDWIDGFQFTGTVIQYGDDLVYYKNGNELTFQPTRYDNMKN